jgi:hypothetical protein
MGIYLSIQDVEHKLPYTLCPLIIRVDPGMFQLQRLLQVCSRRQDQRGNKAEDVSAKSRICRIGAGAGALVIARGVRAVAPAPARGVRATALAIARGARAVATSRGWGSHRGDGLAAGCNHLLAHPGRFREHLGCGRNKKSASMAHGTWASEGGLGGVLLIATSSPQRWSTQPTALS